MKKGFKIFGYIFAALLLIRFCYPLVLPVYQITTDSMEPTISKGDYILVSKLHYKIFNPKINDIVIFKPSEDMFNTGSWAHRIIGVNGDIVFIQDGLVNVNGIKTIFPEIIHENLVTRIEKGYIFQKGDNLKTIAGVLAEDKIIGKVIYNFSKKTKNSLSATVGESKAWIILQKKVPQIKDWMTLFSNLDGTSPITNGGKPFVELTNTKDNIYTFHVWEKVPDSGGKTWHSATFNWYYVNIETSEVQDFFGKEYK